MDKAVACRGLMAERFERRGKLFLHRQPHWTGPLSTLLIHVRQAASARPRLAGLEVSMGTPLRTDDRVVSAVIRRLLHEDWLLAGAQEHIIKTRWQASRNLRERPTAMKKP